MGIDNQVLIWLDDYTACLEKILDGMAIAPTSPQYVIAKSRRERVLHYIAEHASEEQLRAWLGAGGTVMPATYQQEVAALQGITP